MRQDGKSTRFFCFIVCAVAWAGCSSEPALTGGKVTKKWHEHAYNRMVPVTKFDKDGDARIVWETDHVPEEWKIEFEAEGRKRTLSVSEEVYRSTAVGEQFEMVPMELPVTYD